MTDNKNMACKPLTVLVLLMGFVLTGSLHAAVRDGGGNAKIVNKLQTMVKDITAERDALKTENEKTVTELEKLKKESEQQKATAVSEKDKLTSDLAAQKNSYDEIKTRLDNTTAKLQEVINKYNALNKAKNELSAEHSNLQNSHQLTTSELKTCESKNIKMFHASKDVIESYKSCQNKGIVDTLLDSEPVLQINNVEFETLIQEFEDKLNKQQYHNQTAASKTNPVQ